MTDYYSILTRAVAALNPSNEESRADLYDHARDMLEHQLRNQDRSPESAAAEVSAFESVVRRVEAEIAHGEALASRGRQNRRQMPSHNVSSIKQDDKHRPAKKAFSRAVIAALGAVAVAMICIGGVAYLAGRSATTSSTHNSPGVRIGNQAMVRAGEEILEIEDPAPGVDGGSTSDGLPYPLRRQAIFYRTVHHVGTVIIDRSQRFLYLVQPKIVALRYGIAVGGDCYLDVGLHRITRKEHWPEWVPSPALIKRRSYPPRMAGGLGNPLGARALHLDGKEIGIHGTNAPKSIGRAAALGCLRLVNDDIVDLYERTSTENAVVVIN